MLNSRRRWNGLVRITQSLRRYASGAERSPPVFTVVLLSVIGLVALAGAASSVVVTARDGYRAVPTRQA